jgi:uncharacterized protein with PIN domain
VAVSEVRFHLDEHMDHAIAQALRQRGINVTTTNDAGLAGSDDDHQLAYCLRESRVIVTDDYDFLRFASASREHAGVAFCQKRQRTLGQIINHLILIHGALTAEDMYGHIEYV